MRTGWATFPASARSRGEDHRGARAGADRLRAGLLLPRARALTEAIAAALGGVPAGDARRWDGHLARASRSS